jgi:hypothetical protein
MVTSDRRTFSFERKVPVKKLFSVMVCLGLVVCLSGVVGCGDKKTTTDKKTETKTTEKKTTTDDKTGDKKTEEKKTEEKKEEKKG